MQNIIRIKKATFYAYHGVFKQEQNVGGKFEADIDLHTDFLHATETDSLKQTVDYEKVYNLLSDLAMTQKFYLVETLALRLVEAIFENFPTVEKTVIRVRKNNPPIGGVVDCVEVEVESTREEYLQKIYQKR
ncbi:MAG: dihydroneopterin aldolase [Ignavibacteria bacterium]|nr:dihydroneopterin aldolase [Ignavibacteria bacterium]